LTKPFFMLIATRAPHGQGDEGEKGAALTAPAYADAFADIKVPKTLAYEEEEVSDKPPAVSRTPRLSPDAKDEIERTIAPSFSR
jgi:hypothetical protein